MIDEFQSDAETRAYIKKLNKKRIAFIILFFVSCFLFNFLGIKSLEFDQSENTIGIKMGKEGMIFLIGVFVSFILFLVSVYFVVNISLKIKNNIQKTNNNEQISENSEQLKKSKTLNVKALIFAILWIIGLELFIQGLKMHNGQIIGGGALLLSIYGVIPTIKFIFSFPFDSLTKNKKIKEIVSLGFVLDVLVLIFLGPTGLGLVIFPFVALFEIINNLFKTDYLTEEQKNKDIFLVDYNRLKYTIVAIYGIIFGVFYFCFNQTTLAVIDTLIGGNGTIFSSVLGEFLSISTIIMGIIIIILSIFIGYRFGSFTNGPKKYEYIEIRVNGQKYYIKKEIKKDR